MEPSEIEKHVEEMMEQIDAHECAGSDVSLDTSLRFYKELAYHIQERINSIKGDINRG